MGGDVGAGVGAVFHGVPVGFVKEALPFLGMKFAAGRRLGEGIFAVLPDAGTGAVFADADPAGGIIGVDVMGQGREVGGRAAVPAVVLVEGHNGGEPIQGTVVALVRSGSRRPLRVLLTGDGDKLADEIRRDGGLFVEHAPADDGGMVATLMYELEQLLLGVGAEGTGGADAVNEGDLAPKNDAVLVAKLVGKIVVLVMR